MGIAAVESTAERAIGFIVGPFDSPWVRDYGPVVIKSFDAEYEILDFDYHPQEPRRRGDNAIPQTVASSLGGKATRVPLAIEVGNVLSNGAGLCLTTQNTLKRNPGLLEKEVFAAMRECMGAEQCVILEHLVGEPTGHVDMFCAFTAPDVVVVGKYDAADDAVNAKVLDRNARRLAQVRTACGPLRVQRIPMPPHTDREWPTYTNIVFANGLLLVPSYGHEPGDDQAVAVYRRLLPGWEVESVYSSPLIRLGGALHCATMNLHRVPKVGRPTHPTEPR